MAVVTTKSGSITNWDASPTFIPTTGEGVEAPFKVINDNLAAANGDSIGSVYRLVRIPTNAKIKRVILNTTGITVGAGDFDVAFSDSPNESAGYQNFQATSNGVVQLSGGDNKLFGSAKTLVAPITQSDITFTGTFTLAMQNIPLWQALVNLGATQFVADPGGFFDLVIKLTTAITTAGTIGLEVDYAV